MVESVKLTFRNATYLLLLNYNEGTESYQPRNLYHFHSNKHEKHNIQKDVLLK